MGYIQIKIVHHLNCMSNLVLTPSGSFQVGKSGLSESQASQISVWTMLPNGGAWPWSLTAEKRYRNHPLPALQELVKQHDELKCGQAYWITWTGNGDLNIPGFVPTGLVLIWEEYRINFNKGRITKWQI